MLTVGLAFAGYINSRGAATPSFELSFTGTGLVEAVDTSKKGRCAVQIALYDWINLSQGFDLADIPQQNDRYTLHGETETCQALTIAMASTNNHIGFEAGFKGKTWYFASTPAPALGRGGLEIDWTPTPL